MNHFKNLGTLFVLLILPAVLHAQDSAQKVALLPSQLGPIESVMWSEHGAMRTVFDFPLTEDGRDHEMHLRRNMLTAHQIGGFATLAAMIATCTVGQLVYNGGHENLRDAKDVLGWTTVAMYFTTASLSLFTPPPMIRRKEWNSVSTHKLLAGIHFTGMILTPILAAQIRDGHNPDGSPKISRKAETIHMISGYATTAVFATAMMVVTF